MHPTNCSSNIHPKKNVKCISNAPVATNTTHTIYTLVMYVSFVLFGKCLGVKLDASLWNFCMILFSFAFSAALTLKSKCQGRIKLGPAHSDHRESIS